MTAPVPADPAAPVTGVPAPAQPPTGPSDTGVPEGADTDWKAEADKWKALARKHEDQAKANRDAATQGSQAQQQLAAILAAAGLNPDGTPLDDPQALAEQLNQRAEAAEARIWTLGVKDAVYDQAGATGVNAKLIYSSTDFRDMLDDLVDDDPGSPEFRAAVATKMREFVAANPEYAAGPQSRFGAGGDGGPRPDGGAAPQLTEQDLRRMTPEQIVEARLKGQLTDVMRGS